MTWRAYELVYRVMSPVHIGWHTLGYIKLTRHYIPGKAMWGAFTANLSRSGQKDFHIEDYKVFGNLLRTNILVSYFYLAIHNGDGLQAILPQYTEEGFKYRKVGYKRPTPEETLNQGVTSSEIAQKGRNGEYSKEEFERLFISSFGQTAVLPENNTAEDKSLHESEFIMPTIEVGGKSKPVYFIGYLFIKDGVCTGNDRMAVGWEGAAINLKGPLSEIFVGGDRKYGWGRLSLDSEKTRTDVKKIFDIPLVLDKGRPELTIPSGRPIPAHVPINQGIRIKGDIEPLIGRVWGEVENKEKEKIVGFGQEITTSGICWMPGSILSEQKAFHVCAYGVLE